jgi:hypothetical protein
MTVCAAWPRGVRLAAKGDIRRGMMKKTLAVLALCALSQAAYAKEEACRDIQSSSARLACYDLASPPKLQQRAVTESDPSRPAYRDPFIEEHDKTTARLKNICRGC